MGSISGTSPVDLAEGQTLAGKYTLVRKLGEGGMCVVYEAEHIGLRQGLAIKVLKPDLATDADCVARFEREARAAAQLRSPNVAKVFDVDWLPSGQPYITMELLVGRDLGVLLGADGRLPIAIAVDYVRQACSGIAEAHALGIVHRDLKPENLFLTDLGDRTERKLVKILDFGIAKNISDNARRLTAPDAVFGTVDYMSPEQIRSASKVNHLGDLWSLGVILYELLTGRLPYEGDARSIIAQIVSDPIPLPSLFLPELPPALVDTVMKALEKDPAKRFQSADELRDALQGYGEIEPITAVLARLPPESVPRRAARPAAADRSSLPPSDMRDARTHGSWETNHESRRGRPWLRVVALALFVGVVVGVVHSRERTLPWMAEKLPWLAEQLPWLTQTPDPEPAQAPLPPATASVAGTLDLPPFTDASTAGSDTTDGVGDTKGVSATGSAKHAKPPRPRPQRPQPATSAPLAAPWLPKHI